MLKISDQAKPFAGMLYDLQQNSILLRASITLPTSFSRSAVDAAMAVYFEQAIDELPDGITDEEWMVHRYAQWCIALQRNARVSVSSRYRLAKSSSGNAEDSEFGLLLPQSIPLADITACFQWIDQALQENGSDSYDALRKRLSAHALEGINQYFIVDAAFGLDIPVIPMMPGIVCLGTGTSSRWMRSSLTEQTSAIGVALVRNKFLSTNILRRYGLPAPANVLVKSSAQAVEGAERMGYPVVVKPADADRGAGVYAGLRTVDEVVSAYQAASEVSPQIMLEKHIEGSTHRLTVFNGELIRVVKRVAGGVTGDGSSTISELLEKEQATPFRVRQAMYLGRQALGLDEEAMQLMAEEGFRSDSILPDGKYLRLRRRDNINAGGSNIEIKLEDVHPDVRRLVLRVAKLMRLDFAGVDFITQDISTSWLDGGGAICEVNAQPQLGARNNPYLYQRILKTMLPSPATIAAHLLVVTEEAAMASSDISQLQQRLQCQGRSEKTGLLIDDVLVSGSFANSFIAARALLTSNDVGSALCIMSLSDVVKFGTPVNRFNSICLAMPKSCSDNLRAEFESIREVLKPQTDKLDVIYVDQ